MISIKDVSNPTNKNTKKVEYTNNEEIINDGKILDTNTKTKCNKKKKKYILLDADNTLYSFDKEKAYHRLIEIIAKELDQPPEIVEKEYKEVVNEIKFEKNIEIRKREYALTKTIEKIINKYPNKKTQNKKSQKEISKLTNKALSQFWNIIYETTYPTKGVVEFLKNNKDHYHFIVFSDEFRPQLHIKIKNAFQKIGGKRSLPFKDVVSSEDVGEMKPSNKYIKYILEKHKIKKEDVLVVIGDNYFRDLKEAKELGIKTILIKRQARDFLQAYTSICEKGKPEAEYIVDDFNQINKIIKEIDK